MGTQKTLFDAIKKGSHRPLSKKRWGSFLNYLFMSRIVQPFTVKTRPHKPPARLLFRSSTGIPRGPGRPGCTRTRPRTRRRRCSRRCRRGSTCGSCRTRRKEFPKKCVFFCLAILKFILIWGCVLKLPTCQLCHPGICLS